LIANEAVERIWRQPLRWASSIDDYADWKGFHPDGRPYAPAEWPLARALATGLPVPEEEIQIVRGDGSIGTIRALAAPVRHGGGLPLQRQRTDLVAVCRQILHGFEVTHPDRVVELSVAGDAVGLWDRDRLAQLVQNLVGNALEHGHRDRPVRVTVHGEAAR